MSANNFRPVLGINAPVQKLDENSTIWGCEEQPWLDYGITMQVISTRYNQGRSVHVAAEAVDMNTGEVLASASHSTFVHDAVRRIIARRRAA